MTRIDVDLATCQGYANCVVTAGEAFDLGDDGKVRLLSEGLDRLDPRLLGEAVASCPANALRIVDTPS